MRACSGSSSGKRLRYSSRKSLSWAVRLHRTAHERLFLEEDLSRFPLDEPEQARIITSFSPRRAGALPAGHRSRRAWSVASWPARITRGSSRSPTIALGDEKPDPGRTRLTRSPNSRGSKGGRSRPASRIRSASLTIHALTKGKTSPSERTTAATMRGSPE